MKEHKKNCSTCMPSAVHADTSHAPSAHIYVFAYAKQHAGNFVRCGKRCIL